MTSPTQQYRRFNENCRRALVFHLGIDAGFFAEFTYMINAMLYCAVHRYRFELFSLDANFATGGGWTDYFEPFCPERTEAFHKKLNVHHLPSWREMLRRSVRERRPSLLWWKLKTLLLALLCRLRCRLAYGRSTLCTYNVNTPVQEHYLIPELGIDGTYAEAFAFMTRVVWHLNPATRLAADRLLGTLNLPPAYAGTQLRGGDKITEVALQPVSLTAQALLHTHCAGRTVLLLTDDYRLAGELQALMPQWTIRTLCRPTEQGYVNSAFVNTGPQAKRESMLRFLAQIEGLLGATSFVGSITNGPSLFLLKVMGKKAHTTDCDPALFPLATRLPIAGRGEMSRRFLSARGV